MTPKTYTEGQLPASTAQLKALLCGEVLPAPPEPWKGLGVGVLRDEDGIGLSGYYYAADGSPISVKMPPAKDMIGAGRFDQIEAWMNEVGEKIGRQPKAALFQLVDDQLSVRFDFEDPERWVTIPDQGELYEELRPAALAPKAA